ncbi:MAG TPA: CBS domain-containing protein [Pyrinomonadaceae bacterium]|nr:CBS domain-containing protein [Pyrinomonadaceae bacterium]
MGEHNINLEPYDHVMQAFTRALLDDLRALEYMLEHDLVERDVVRIGAEQELFLIDQNLCASPVATEVLVKANDSRLQTEIARFNLEANLTPLDLKGRCFHQLNEELDELVAVARDAANSLASDVLLAGILPTLARRDLTLENITPAPRYFQLNRTITRLRGGPFSIHIKGTDELYLTHENIMMESCNTSFQVHVQVNPRDFANLYNCAQLITAPVLAAAVNSPLLFGHRLWQETRLALFQHSTDARSQTQQARSHPTRVGFGEKWLERSVIEIFHDQISRFRVIMVKEPDENPLQVLARGEMPLLSALCAHNGTIWPWNRACYGVSKGVAHLRIENRALPSGPTTMDEIANAAFFVGLLQSLPKTYGEISQRLSFTDAKANFFRAARHGLNAQFTWVDGTTHAAVPLILNELLPQAREGLKEAGVDSSDVDYYLGIIEERVRSGQTGAQWMVRSLSAMEGTPEGPRSKDLRHRILTATIRARQREGEPVHRWPLIKVNDTDDWTKSYQTVGQFMSTDLFTVRPDDLIDLAASVMDWRHIRHVPVEDEQGRLVGLVTHRSLLRLLSRGGRTTNPAGSPILVREIMKTDPVTVESTTSTLKAIEIMRTAKLGCLPVVDQGELVGIVTSFDFLEASARLFKKSLSASA